MVAVVCSALSVAVVLGLDNAARRLARAVRSPSIDDGSELLRTLTEREREREILKLFAPGDRRETEQQRAHGAQRCVGRPEEAGVQDRKQMVAWAVRIGLVNGGMSQFPAPGTR